MFHCKKKTLSNVIQLLIEIIVMLLLLLLININVLIIYFEYFSVNDGRTTTTPQYRGLASAFITIFRQEGLSGLYKGVTPNVCGSGSAWGFYFLL